MNKRIKKKKFKYIIHNIQKFNLEDNECLVFKYDKKQIKVSEIANFADYIRDNISNKIIFIPKEMEVSKASNI